MALSDSGSAMNSLDPYYPERKQNSGVFRE